MTSPLAGAAEPLPPALEVDATLYRSRGGAREPLPAGALVRPGDQIFLEIHGSQPAHVYLLNEDQAGRVYLLFPLPGLDLTNPLAAGKAQRLPGSRGGMLQDWRVTEGQGRESFLLVAARRPLDSLEERLADLPRAEPSHPVAAAPFDAVGMLGQRGVGGMAPAVPSEAGDSTLLLSAIARELSARQDDPGGLWIREFWVHNLGR